MAFPAWGPAGPGAASAWVQSAELGLPTDLSRAVRRAPAVPDSEPLGVENWELTLLVSPCAPGGHRAVTSGARRTAVSSGPPCHPAFPSAIHFAPRRLFHEASGLWFSRLGGRPALQGGCQATFLPGGPAAHCTPHPSLTCQASEGDGSAFPLGCPGLCCLMAAGSISAHVQLWYCLLEAVQSSKVKVKVKAK